MIDLAKKYKQSAIKKVRESEMLPKRKEAYETLIETCEDDMFRDIVQLFEYEVSFLRKFGKEKKVT